MCIKLTKWLDTHLKEEHLFFYISEVLKENHLAEKFHNQSQKDLN